MGMEAGCNPTARAASAACVIGWALAEAEGEPQRRPPRWTEAEDAFLEASLGFLSEDAIAKALGRTPIAVRIRWKRDLGLPAPSKAPGYLTARRAADLLGVDVHAVCAWIAHGWLPAQWLPFQGRRVRRIRVQDLKRFLIKPEHWMLFRLENAQDPGIRKLVALAQERWGDEWLTSGQVAELHGVDDTDVNRFIHAGKLAGRKWGNWWIRRSDAERVYFPKGRGSGHEQDWSEEGDAFMVLARAVGLSLSAIDRLTTGSSARAENGTARRAGSRLTRLVRKHQVPLILEKYGLESVQFRQGGRRLLADWQLYRSRFPTLARAMDRFAEGRQLSAVEAECVRGVLWTWAAYFLGTKHPLTRRLQVPGKHGLSVARLRKLRAALEAAGVDLFGGETKDTVDTAPVYRLVPVPNDEVLPLFEAAIARLKSELELDEVDELEEEVQNAAKLRPGAST
jgi:hypothetical protein